ncbi:MAG: glycosyltransferase family 2 protein [Burkholderiales bacterium]
MPKFSIIIPVKAINDYVRETVSYIQRLNTPEWELFIIPNEKEPNEWFGDERIRVTPSGRIGPADKRDMGAKLSNGDILVFLDDDSYPEANLLEVASHYLSNPDVIALGGPGITPPSDSFWQRVSGAVFLSRFTGGAPERYVPVGIAREMDDWPSVNLMVRREAFLAIRGFDCKYWPGEDTKLCLKLKQTGKKLLYVPSMIVWHHRRAGFWAHMKQVGGYGLHRGYFARHYPETSFRLRYFLPSFFLIFALMSPPLIAVLPSWYALPFVAIWGLYGAMLCIGFIGIRRHESWRVAATALLYSMATHIVYGAKFLRGFFKKDQLVSKLR